MYRSQQQHRHHHHHEHDHHSETHVHHHGKHHHHHHHHGNHHHRRRISIAGVFYVLVMVFLAARIAWFSVVLFDAGHDYTQFSVNVAADCLFFSCFSLIVLHWAETNASTTVGGESRVFGGSALVAWLFLAVNCVLYAFQSAVLLYIDLTRSEDAALILSSLLVAILDNAIVGVGFCAFGMRLYCVMRNARHTVAVDDATLGGQRRRMRGALLVTLLMTACFLARAVLYVEKIATAQSALEMMYVSSIGRIVCIFISELVPVLYQLWLQRARKKQEETHNRFIQDLYDQNDSMTKEEGETESLITSVASEQVIN